MNFPLVLYHIHLHYDNANLLLQASQKWNHQIGGDMNRDGASGLIGKSC